MLLGKPFILPQRRHFTLLEMLITMSLIVVVSAVVGINIVRARNDQSFQTGAEQLADKLRLAQDFMLMLHADVRVKITSLPDAKGIQCTLDVDKTLSPNLKRLVHHHENISGVKAAVFIDAQQNSHSEAIELLFLSNGSRMSQGNLYLYQSQDTSEKSKNTKKIITLHGYPKLIDAPTSGETTLASSQSTTGNLACPQEAMEIWLKSNQANTQENNVPNNSDKKTPRATP